MKFTRLRLRTLEVSKIIIFITKSALLFSDEFRYKGVPTPIVMNGSPTCWERETPKSASFIRAPFIRMLAGFKSPQETNLKILQPLPVTLVLVDLDLDLDLRTKYQYRSVPVFKIIIECTKSFIIRWIMCILCTVCRAVINLLKMQFISETFLNSYRTGSYRL